MSLDTDDKIPPLKDDPPQGKVWGSSRAAPTASTANANAPTPYGLFPGVA